MADEGKGDVWRTALSLEGRCVLPVPRTRMLGAEWLTVGFTHVGCQSCSYHITIDPGMMIKPNYGMKKLHSCLKPQQQMIDDMWMV